MTGLVCRGVRVARSGKSVLHDVDLLAPPGAITAILGPNGAGKSTLLHALAGGVPSTMTELSLDGEDLLRMPRRERARRLALVEQEPGPLEGLRARDVVALGRIPHEGAWRQADGNADAVVEHSLQAVDGTALAARRYATLSGGEKQRVQLARALAQEPRMLLLDEPTNHLDVRAQLAALAVVRARAAGGATVVAALHDLSLAMSAADHVVVMAQGRVVAAGGPAQVLTPALIRDVWQVHADILTNPTTGRAVVALAEAFSVPAVAGPVPPRTGS
ncbi:MAG: ABC transporter ATP-binding protein [Microbacterium sp.]|uniref:ABC transporter ATP-binding protein n=1 Tax=Microbacterium sp. TaxID=51671 RepID=UPI003A8C2712